MASECTGEKLRNSAHLFVPPNHHLANPQSTSLIKQNASTRLSSPYFFLPKDLWIAILKELTYFDLRRIAQINLTFRAIVQLPACDRHLLRESPSNSSPGAFHPRPTSRSTLSSSSSPARRRSSTKTWSSATCRLDCRTCRSNSSWRPDHRLAGSALL